MYNISWSLISKSKMINNKSLAPKSLKILTYNPSTMP